MGQKTAMANNFDYEWQSSRDPRYWALLLFGAVFLYGGLTIDPLTNCNESGECAPILVPIAAMIGILVTVGSAAQIAANTKRGSCIDPATGDLMWWQNRTRKHDGDHGRIHPSRIGSIRLVRESEKADGLHLYDLGGVRQPYFDEEVIPRDVKKWAGRLTALWPHIAFEVIE